MARRSMLVDNPARRASIRGNRLRQRSLPINPFVLEVLEERQLLATITVNTASDAGAAPTTLSLRQAIEISNGTLAVSSLTSAQQAQVSGALSSPNTIDFDIPGAQGTLHDIALSSPLPAITSSVIVNGYSQPGASPNTNGPGLGDNAVLNVEIDGTSVGSGASGLVVAAGSSTIEGLIIANFGSQVGGTGGNGIVLQTAGGNLIAGNFIGTNSTGTAGTNIAADDVLIESGSSGNTVGGLTPGARDVLVNNNAGGSTLGAGVDIEGASANLVVGNFVGTSASGTMSLAGGTSSLGILIAAGATNNTVGGTTAAARNLISGNKGSGVQIGAATDQSATSGNVVAGNWVGTDVTGLLALGNGFGASPGGDGVDLVGTNSTSNTVGGSTAAAGNIISGNAYDGIFLNDARDDTLEFNLVGADDALNFSKTQMGNADFGIELDDAPQITISRNLIVNNLTGGVALFYAQTSNALIANNEIILNNGDGILFCSCGDGGSAIYGNLIGTSASGTVNLGNKGYGIDIGSANNTVGGTAVGEANTIAFNTKAGIGLEKLNTDTGNTISANSIYSNKTLGIDLGESGVPLQDNSGVAQTGPNDLENYPVLSTAVASNASTTITGSLTSMADRKFTIDFFGSPSADHSGYGEGQTFIGSTTVTTNSAGNASFAFVAPTSVAGQMLSATATDQNGNTSEFAKSIQVTTGPPSTPIGTTTVLSVSPAGALAGQPVTLTAAVSAADGSAATGNVIFFVNGQALGPAVPLAVVKGQEIATFTTSLTTAATYELSAQYQGGSTYSGSSSNTITDVVSPVTQPNPQPAPQPTIGPAVVSVEWLGNHSTSTTIVLQFNQSLDAGPAQTKSNYTILTRGLHGQFGKGSKHIALKSAIYNAASHTVTLRASRPLKVGQRYQLTLEAAVPGGLVDNVGIMLDAASLGGQGTNFVAPLDRHDFVLNLLGPSAKARPERDAIVKHHLHQGRK
jgi:hypothetical protein